MRETVIVFVLMSRYCLSKLIQIVLRGSPILECICMSLTSLKYEVQATDLFYTLHKLQREGWQFDEPRQSNMQNARDRIHSTE